METAGAVLKSMAKMLVVSVVSHFIIIGCKKAAKNVMAGKTVFGNEPKKTRTDYKGNVVLSKEDYEVT